MEGEAAPSNWHDQFLAGTDLAENPNLVTIPDVPTLAKAFVDTKRALGQKQPELAVPKEEDPPESWEAFYQKLGRPEKAEAYEFKKPELPEKFPYAPELEATFKSLAHQAGLSPRQAQAIYDGYLKVNLEQFQQSQVQRETTMKEMVGGLQKKWGDKYETNLDTARKAQKLFAPAGSEGLAAMDELMGDDPRLVELFYNIGSRMSEAGLVMGQADSSGLESQCQALTRSEAYLNARHPEHKQTVQKVKEIYEKLYPNIEEK